ncbi:D-ornithine 4,5-aminomutase S subunit [Desulfosporosinus acidiphilus SJ4]|uniref:D-ornithine 4,5-aminomutase S subunit n=1 Tax=Desulfosporosinus acidiphilus (strain DSM 22704 / JCM 16185 / SJ4) TaxID=646529 RepID=I4D4X9_DESAJ|nr:ornithine aminomutase subunit alpha [Desulfosporosinus acidiphilus]AFM40853.1 D-ornithine 4,5-aminomutase S subunit [Desulfosporosinus acidiphilus SJ4]
MQRKDDYEVRRAHLAELSEKELEERFWLLTNQIVDPLLELARTHTSPSIERSVLLRMGLDSLTAKGVVEKALLNGVLEHGAGHCVWRYAEREGLELLQAAEKLARGEGWETIKDFFGEVKHNA